MNSIQKEKIAHEKHLLSQGVDFKYLPNIQYNELENVYELIEWDEEYSEALNEINSSWCTWQAAKAQAVQGWISVEDGLPAKFGMRVRIKRNWWDEDDNDVVVESEATFDKDSDFCELSHKTYEYETWFDHQLNKYLDEGYVTHWMPLPDAPQEPTND